MEVMASAQSNLTCLWSNKSYGPFATLRESNESRLYSWLNSFDLVNLGNASPIAAKLPPGFKYIRGFFSCFAVASGVAKQFKLPCFRDQILSEAKQVAARTPAVFFIQHEESVEIVQ